ncbi:enoyl-CoA hydratase/isomerase family protein [Smaragdicoccus niigatensis]|uniref:enoyl-CoA hydratase/isomerase family protein n=1 Tax=Smaragdicoccus niigatensis TaxID=359359 RepID=UPI00037B9158|nr:enoyl-CoA hydratase-related protein [Smaragdicoccus niigatensis]
MFETVDYSVTDRVGVIRLNRPTVLNAWSGTMGRDLTAAVAIASRDPSVRSIVLCGAGRAFCAGGDLNEDYPRNAAGYIDMRRTIEKVSTPLMLALRDAPKPVIAAVHGPVAGIGCSLAFASDFVLAAESTYFLLAFTKVGLVPDGGALAFINARIGPTRATELALLAERLPAVRALDWGLINAIHPADALEAEAFALAQRLADGPPVAFANTKRMVNAAAYSTLREQLALEADLQQEQSESGEYDEGVAAFLEKRPPRFGDRVQTLQLNN